ncbi:hypothetical protein BH09MYX1_BH09MYX1_44580 [soil metagenome]
MIDDPLGLVGTKIEDKYQIESVVGEGGFAIVYRAQHLIFKRPVAIKAFRALSDFGPEERERLLQGFIQEGALLADLSERSAAILQARDIGTLTTSKGEWVPYMVLEWLEGITLEGLIEHEKTARIAPRTLDQAVKLLDSAAEGLALAHKRGVAHRDVKPANIFGLGDPRSTDATVKLLDFGIAKVVQDAQKASGAFTKTSGTITSFTPAYGAPEQFDRSHGSTGPWTDVFAFALVMVEVLTHQKPLDGDSFVQLGFASANPGKRPTPRNKGANVPDEVENVFAKALAPRIEDRYQNAADFWNELRTALHMKPMRMSMVEGPNSAIGSSRTQLSPDIGMVQTIIPDPHSTHRPITQSPSSMMTSAKSTNPLVYVGVAAFALTIGGIGAYFALKKGGEHTMPAASVSASGIASVIVPTKPTCPKDMIYIDGGEFFMGSSDTRAKDNEKPTHHVELSPFCIARTEVTVGAYKSCSDVGKCDPAPRENAFGGLDDGLRKTLDPLCNIREPGAKKEHPINCVDWEQAEAFCKVDGGRLPTEAEWEFAARGPDGRAYPWGNDDPSGRFLNACGKECLTWAKKNGVEGSVVFATMYNDEDPFATTAPVGSFPDGKSRYGLQDVVGNVWEWTGDFYADYTKDSAKDPTGPKSGDDGRVARGGAWNGGDPSWVRPTFRFHFPADSRSYGVGFRCAKTPK